MRYNYSCSIYQEAQRKEITLDEPCYNSLLAACGMENMSSDITTIFEEMKTKGIPLKEASYLAVIRALASLGKPEVC